jgi:hypothetical protein
MPAIGGTTVSIVYTPSSGSPVTHQVTTDGSGHYTDKFDPPTGGTWQAQAHWPGDKTHLPSDSAVCTITVGKG